MSQENNLEMNQDLFANIPPEIIIEIISKLPVRTIINCRCVCKSWLGLIETHEFVKSHMLKSIPGLVVVYFGSKLLKLFEFDDGLDLHYKLVAEFNIPGWISGTANGLLFLCNWDRTVHDHETLHICNPITRDFIQIDGSEFVRTFHDNVTYGFGSSKITGQHKVVRLSQGYVTVPGEYNFVPNSECLCHVYTIGTGLWRRIPDIGPLKYNCCGAFLNGNLHWLVSDFEGHKRWIFWFDLETELCSTFSSPLLESAYPTGLTIFRDCLCLCDNSSADGSAIWLMKEYGVEKSWTKQFFISNDWHFEPDIFYGDNAVYPIKIFEDGDILLVWQCYLLYYLKTYNTVQKLEMLDHDNDIDAILYTPSFLSLKSFGMEKLEDWEHHDFTQSRVNDKISI